MAVESILDLVSVCAVSFGQPLVSWPCGWVVPCLLDLLLPCAGPGVGWRSSLNLISVA